MTVRAGTEGSASNAGARPLPVFTAPPDTTVHGLEILSHEVLVLCTSEESHEEHLNRLPTDPGANVLRHGTWQHPQPTSHTVAPRGERMRCVRSSTQASLRAVCFTSERCSNSEFYRRPSLEQDQVRKRQKRNDEACNPVTRLMRGASHVKQLLLRP